jgi:hypothetical protein
MRSSHVRVLNRPPGAPVKADGELPTGHLHPEKIIVDVEACTAKIPGTGDEPIALTEIGDVGRGVAAACALEAAWTPYTGYLVRETTTYNEVVRLAEGVRGEQPRSRLYLLRVLKVHRRPQV